MKRKISLILALAMVLLTFAACGGGTAPSSAPDSSAPESSGGSTDWPTKPITIIVPAGAGGDTDLNARVFAKYLQEELGQTVVISNIKGISVAFQEIKNASPDGYTAGVYHPGFFVSSALGTVDVAYTDFAVTNVYAIDKQSAWFVSKDAEFQTLDDLAAASKSEPIGFATEVGSMSHLTELLFMQLVEGSQFNIVDAGGSADKITALMSGQLDLMFNQVGLVKDYLKNGDFVCLGIMAEERSEANPDIPTFKEQGYDIVFDKPYWLFFPAETDQAIVDKMNTAIEAVCQNPDYAAELLDTMQTVPGDMNHDEAMEYLGEINTMYADLLASMQG
ncbi:MAG: tripartite tricarboxylate transporter substrate binding protein [Candidatus Heteroscillospira sp.]